MEDFINQTIKYIGMKDLNLQDMRYEAEQI